MTKKNMTIRMEPELKAEAQKIFSSLGMDMSTAINVFLKQVVRLKGIPFELRLEEPNATTVAAIDAAENGNDMYGPFDSVADLMEALNA